MTAVPYDGPFPPENCIGSRFAQYDDDFGILCMVRGGDAVFWIAGGDMLWIERWHTDERLRKIR